MLAEAVMVITAAAGVLVIGERVEATAEWVTLWPCILLQVGVLFGGEVSVKGGSVVVRAGIV